MKKILFFMFIALNAMVLHAFVSKVGGSELASLLSIQADESVTLLDSIVSYLPDGSLSGKIVYEYDNKGLLDREITYKWQEESWKCAERKEYTYYKNGKLKKTECYSESSYWLISYKEEWTYDDHGNPASWDYYMASRGYFTSVTNTKYENTYDENANLTNVTSYNLHNREWTNNEKTENAYDSRNRLASSVQYSWEEGEWLLKKKHEYSYDVNGNMTADDCLSWWNGNWYNSQRFEKTYDDNGNLLSYAELFAGDGWEYLNKTEYTYDAEGNVADETKFDWNFDRKEWSKTSYSVYSFSAHAMILPGTPTVSDTYDFEVDGIEYSILSLEDCTVEVSNTRHVAFDELVIPASISIKGHELKVVAIGQNAIYYNGLSQESKSYKSIQLPETIETIGRNAFYNQNYLEEIELPESLASIGNSAFAGCMSLKKVSFNKGLKSLGDSAFYYCGQLEEVNLPDGVETIGMRAFSQTGIHSFNFPSSIKNVGSYLFAGCNNLEFVDLENLQALGKLPSALFSETGVKKVVIPDWVTEIPEYFVQSCKEIEEFECGKSVTIIKERAFVNCDLPDSFTLPETLKVIEKYAFLSALVEGSVVIPGNVEEIGDYALFITCDSLIFEPSDKPLLLNSENYYVINSNESYCLRLDRCIKAKVLPEGIPYSVLLNGAVIELGKNYLDSFVQSDSYDIQYDRPFKLTILEGVEDLNFSYSCEHTINLLLPSTLKTISASVFKGTKRLTNIDCRATEPPLCDGKILADGVYAKAKLTVPPGCKEAYQNAEGWKYFWEIEETIKPFYNDESETGITDIEDDDSGWFSINNGVLKAPAAIELYSMDGRLVKHAADGNISDIVPGIYVVKCGSRTAKIVL